MNIGTKQIVQMQWQDEPRQRPYKKPTAADRLFEQMKVGVKYKYCELPPLAEAAMISNDEQAIAHNIRTLYKKGLIKRHHITSLIEWEREK